MNPALPRPALRAAAAAFVPALAAGGDPAWTALETTIATALAARPPSVVRQLRAVLRLLDLVSLLRYGRTFARLDQGRRLTLLESLERSSLLLLRRGVWGLRTLVFMGHYTRPEVIADLGYRADPAGWSARR